jgi:hypothetical protein
MGLGRVVHPVKAQGGETESQRNLTQLELIKTLLKDPEFNHVYFDISWDEVAKYAVATPNDIKKVTGFMNAYHERLLFGTDNVAPNSQATHLKVYHIWDPIWKNLDATASLNIRKKNYEKLFDRARVKVRAWEKNNIQNQ